MKEVGSEFWMIDAKKREEQFFLSGRTALEYIIRNIIFEEKIESVLLPSWCCHTMIEPFVRHGISIRFYDVYFEEECGLCVDIPLPLENEIFYHMTYFGSSDLKGMDERYVRENWKCIICDYTHSWLGKKYVKYPLVPDYVYISYRKWTGIYGIALARKVNGKFTISIEKKSAEKYELLRNNANQLKKRYMEGENINKNSFLELYAEAEGMLEMDYVDYGPSLASVEQLLNLDCQYIKNKRLKNALVLKNALSGINNIKIVFSNLKDNDAPLFVPILVDKKERNKLKQFLIDSHIYCPVHWGLTDYHKGISERAEKIYYQELSLLCDQRYNVKDMIQIAEKIKQFYLF